MQKCDWCKEKLSSNIVKVLLRMDNGDKIICAVHKECFDKIKIEEFYPKIVEGWEEELRESQMDDKYKEEYRNKYYNLKITSIRRF